MRLTQSIPTLVVALALTMVAAPLVGAQPHNDDCSSPVMVGTLADSLTTLSLEVDITSATSAVTDPTTHCGVTSQTYKTLWYEMYAEVPGSFYVEIASTPSLAYASVFDASTTLSCGLQYSEPIDCSNFIGTDTTLLMTSLDACTTYAMEIYTFDDNTSATTMTVMIDWMPDAFYTNVSASVLAGCTDATATIYLASGSTESLDYDPPTTGVMYYAASCDMASSSMVVLADTPSTMATVYLSGLAEDAPVYFRIYKATSCGMLIEILDGCDCFEFVTECEVTPTVTPTETVTPTQSETPTASSSVSPTVTATVTPTPTNIIDEDFPETPGDTGGWIWINAVPFLSEPTSGVPGGRLTITATNAVDNFGIWQSPPETIPGDLPTEIDADALFRARYWVGTDVADRTTVPSIRMRTNDVNLTQSNALRINSIGQARLSPVPAAPSEYNLWFQSGEVASGWNYLAFEMINVGRENPVDSPDGLIFLDRVKVDKIGDTILALAPAVPLQTYAFDGNSPEGWSPSDAGIVTPFDQPTTSIENTRLQLTALNNTNTFGFWTSPEVTIPILQDWLIRARFTCGSDVTAQDLVPQIRCRVEQSDFEQVSVVTVDSTGPGGNSPVDGTDRTYPVWLQIPDTASGLFLSFDLLDVGMSDAPDATVSLDGVVVEAFVPADIIP